MPLNPRVWPWWGWAIAIILVLLCLLLSAVIAVRLQGQAALQQVLADLRSRRLIYLPAEFAARAPAVDSDRQQRAWDQQQRLLSAPWADAASRQWLSMDQRFPGPKAGTPPTGQAAVVSDSGAERALWQALHREGPVVLTGFGWLRQDVPSPAELGVGRAAALRTSNLRSIRVLANALAATAAASDDPRAALADLDALVAALQPTAMIIDAFIQTSAATIRDQAWLEAATRGTDPTPWIAELPDPLLAVADGFAGERAWLMGGLLQDVTAGRNVGMSTLVGVPGSGPLPSLSSWVGGMIWNTVAPFDVAFALDWEGRIEERLRGRPAPLGGLYAAVMDKRWLHPISSMAIPNCVESGASAITQHAAAREYRIAAVLLWHWRQTGALPADAAAVSALLPRDLLTAHGDHPAIQYAVVAPGRFRLWVDPATPATDLLPAGRIDTPKSGSGPWTRGRWWLELDVNQLPAP